jgi:hypothetical protein
MITSFEEKRREPYDGKQYSDQLTSSKSQKQCEGLPNTLRSRNTIGLITGGLHENALLATLHSWLLGFRVCA